VAFATLVVLHSRPTTDRASLAVSLALIGSLTPMPFGDSASPPEVTLCSSVPCRPQTPWYGGVNENAFVSIVQTRPSPTFGRPVHLRGGPHRLQPGTSPHALRIPSHDEHPALRRITPPADDVVTAIFGYGAPHSSARGTSTLPNNALLSAHYRPVW